MKDTRIFMGFMNDAQREAHKRLQEKLNITSHSAFTGNWKEDEEEGKLSIDVSIIALYDIGWDKSDIAVHLNSSLQYVKAVIAQENYKRNKLMRKK